MASRDRDRRSDATRAGRGVPRQRQATGEQFRSVDQRPPDQLETRSRTTEGQRLERVEERLVPRVERVKAGDVVLTKHVVEEPESVSVMLAHDRLDLERRPVQRPLEPGEQPVVTRGEETVVLVVEERLEVRKVPYVVEEIYLRRHVVQEERQLTDTVRKERFVVDARGEVELHVDGADAGAKPEKAKRRRR